MKNAARRIVPVLLVLLILASLVWYIFVYDPGLTRDLLLSQARYHSTKGNAKLSSWFYDLAYKQTGQDDIVAIELANQFKSEGNYTKAEYTLSNAIADGGTAELYIALCKTYVEQDKLLDAVNMLDTIRDPAIRQELALLRPAAPTSDPEPAFYSQYVSVTLISEEGTLYYTTNGEYPSTDEAPYSEPITLPAGETTITAVAVADNGLVSPLSILGFTVSGVIEPVYFDDPAIEREIRIMLGREDEELLYSSELWTITEFTVPSDAVSCEDLVNLPYLETLRIRELDLSSLHFLTSLTYLKELELTGCRFPAEELAPIAALPLLEDLTLADCALSTIAGLENARNLKRLDLSGNTLRDLSPLASLAKLKKLQLQHNALTSLADLAGLTGLELLDVSYNSLTTLAPLAACSELTTLNVSHNALASLSTAEHLSKLSVLTASYNELTDLAVLSGCGALTELYVDNNLLTSISPLGSLSDLQVLNFAHNEVEALPTWPEGSLLRSIDGSYNALTSLASLGNLQELTHVYLDYNQITSVSELESCYKLVLLNIYGNKVTGVEALTEHDVIVNFDPTVSE